MQGYRIEWRLGGTAAQSFRCGLRDDWDGNEAQASYFPKPLREPMRGLEKAQGWMGAVI